MRILTILLLFLPLAAYAAEPDWATNNGKSAQYPDSLYITGYGVASSNGPADNQACINAAKEQARLDLVQRIKVTISATLNSGKMETDSIVHSYFGTVVQASTNIEVQGLKIEPYWNNSVKQASALASVKRETLVNSYHSKAAALRQKINDQIAAAAKLGARKNEALDRYLSCYPLFRELEEVTTVLTVAGGTTGGWAELRTEIVADIALQSQVRSAVDVLLNAPIKTVDDAVVNVITCLAKQLQDRPITVMVIPPGYRDTKMGSPFSRQLAQSIEAKGAASAKWTVMRPDAGTVPSQGNLVRGFVPGTEFVLSGSYWETPDGIKLTVTLSRTGKGEIVGGTEVVIPTAAVSLPCKPQNFSAAMADQLAFSENELLSSGLTIEVWTDRGAENVLYSRDDTMSVFVRVNIPCNIQFIYHLADGKRTLLYDSLYIDQSKVNKVVPIQQKFICREPFGAEVLQVLASTTGFNPIKTQMVDGYKVITDNLKTFLSVAKGMVPISQSSVKPLQSEARLVVTTMSK